MGTNLHRLKDLKNAAKNEVGAFAWVTFWLAVGTITTIVSATTLALTGLIPLWLAALVNLCAFIAGYTVGHEIIHGNLVGRHVKLSWLNIFFGTLFFSAPFHSLTLHSFIHLRHHSHTNDPDKDPDAWIDERKPLILLFRLLTHYLHYQYHGVKWSRDMSHRTQFLVRCFLEQAIPMLIAIMLAASGFGLEVLWLWIIPAILVYPILAFILDWVPHNGLKVGTPLDNSRLLGAPDGAAGRVFSWIYLFQNYHLIHHLYPKVPFYRYRELYENHFRALSGAGAKIYSGFDVKRPSAG
ncbi:MAG: fatty acid desaturase [Aquisalinus sp.]|nr:fatty acid desaturase [Aquisalinus sp.]